MSTNNGTSGRAGNDPNRDDIFDGLDDGPPLPDDNNWDDAPAPGEPAFPGDDDVTPVHSGDDMFNGIEAHDSTPGYEEEQAAADGDVEAVEPDTSSKSGMAKIIPWVAGGAFVLGGAYLMYDQYGIGDYFGGESEQPAQVIAAAPQPRLPPGIPTGAGPAIPSIPTGMPGGQNGPGTPSLPAPPAANGQVALPSLPAPQIPSAGPAQNRVPSGGPNMAAIAPATPGLPSPMPGEPIPGMAIGGRVNAPSMPSMPSPGPGPAANGASVVVTSAAPSVAPAPVAAPTDEVQVSFNSMALRLEEAQRNSAKDISTALQGGLDRVADTLATRLNAFDSKLDGVRTSINSMGERMGGMESRVAALEAARGGRPAAATPVAASVPAAQPEARPATPPRAATTQAAARTPARAAARPAERREAAAPRGISGWSLRGVSQSAALVENASGQLVRVEMGENVPGIGVVRKIQREGDGFVLVTSQGTVRQD